MYCCEVAHFSTWTRIFQWVFPLTGLQVQDWQDCLSQLVLCVYRSGSEPRLYAGTGGPLSACLSTQPAGSNCGHFLLTNIYTHTNREKEAWAELQLGLPLSRVTNGTGADGPLAHSSTKASNLTTLTCDSTLFCRHTNVDTPMQVSHLLTRRQGGKPHLPVESIVLCQYVPFSDTETRLLQTPFKTVGV